MSTLFTLHTWRMEARHNEGENRTIHELSLIEEAYEYVLIHRRAPLKIALLYFNGFAEFEIVFASLIFHHEHEIISLALENRPYQSGEGQKFCVDSIINEIDANTIDLLVIPGGDTTPLMQNQELKDFIEKLLSSNKKVGGICGGAGLLAGLGILDGKKCTGGGSGVKPGDSEYEYYSKAILSDEHVVVDGNIITSQGQAYIEFAVELARQMGVYKNQEEYDADLAWLKNIR